MNIRKKAFKGTKVCPSCGRTSIMGNYCCHCGNLLGISTVEIKSRICCECGEEIPDKNYCINCGNMRSLDFDADDYEPIVPTPVEDVANENLLDASNFNNVILKDIMEPRKKEMER